MGHKHHKTASESNHLETEFGERERERESGKVMEKKKEIKIWHLRHLLAVNATAILYAALHRLSRLSLVVKVSYLLRHEIGARHTFSK